MVYIVMKRHTNLTEYYCKLPDPIDQRLIVVLDQCLLPVVLLLPVDFIKLMVEKSIKFYVYYCRSRRGRTSCKAHPDVQTIVVILIIIQIRMLYLSGVLEMPVIES